MKGGLTGLAGQLSTAKTGKMGATRISLTLDGHRTASQSHLAAVAAAAEVAHHLEVVGAVEVARHHQDLVGVEAVVVPRLPEAVPSTICGVHRE